MAYGGEVVEQGSGAAAAVEEGGQAAGPAPRRAPIGPAMPSHAMLMQAQQAAAEYAQQVVLRFPPLAVPMPSVLLRVSCFLQAVTSCARYSPVADFLNLKHATYASDISVGEAFVCGVQGLTFVGVFLCGVCRALLPLTMTTMTTKTRLDRLSPGRKNGSHPKSECNQSTLLSQGLALYPFFYCKT